MYAFLQYLWKEWRDQRAVVLGCLVAIPVLLSCVAFTLPDNLRYDSVFPMVAALACFGLGIVAIAAETLPGESRRNTMRFLARMPQGMSTVFWAKFLVTATLLVAMATYGWLVAALLGVSELDPRFGVYLVAGVGIAVWVFVVSAWLPRGALALPGAIVTLGAFAMPVLLVWNAHAFPEPNPRYVSAGITILVVGGVLAAWWSFARGRRFGGGAWSSAWRGLALTLVLFVPGWAYAAAETYDHQSAPDVRDSRTRISVRPNFGPGFRFAFVNTLTRRMVDPTGSNISKPIMVDLRTGRWRAVGKRGDAFRYVFKYGATPRVAELLDAGEPGNKRGHVWTHYFDAATGEKIHSGWSDMPDKEVESLRGSVVRRFRPRVVHDPFRKRDYRIPDDLDRGSYRVLESGWIARVGRGAEWRRYDLERGVCFGPPIPPPGLILDAHRYTHRNSVVDLRDGSTTKVIEAEWISWRDELPDGTRLAEVRNGVRRAWVRIDPKTLAVHRVDGILADHAWNEFTFSAVDGGSMIGVWKSKQIIRVSVDTGQHEVLFPR